MAVNPISSANAAVSQITSVIRHAAQAVGTSFSYLLATAKMESNFNPNAQASTSSARGLFQFIEQTWLSTMKEAGARLGYGHYASAITEAPSGRMEVTDPAMRTQILNLRSDPAANAAMAGAYTRNNADYLTRQLGRAPTEGELYIAHFLGAGGAAKLIQAAGNSQVSAAALFPAAAAANRSIFFDRQGRARSAEEVCANLTERYAAARARTGTMLAVAAAAPPPQGAAPPPQSAVPPAQGAVPPPQGATPTPDPAAMAQAFAAPDGTPIARVSEPVFYALFHTGERQAAVAPRISQLWSLPSPPASHVAAADAPGKPLNLFQNMRPTVRSLFTDRG
jgi:Transglycosylase SLT domain